VPADVRLGLRPGLRGSVPRIAGILTGLRVYHFWDQAYLDAVDPHGHRSVGLRGTPDQSRLLDRMDTIPRVVVN
jgi:hypothetical protein